MDIKKLNSSIELLKTQLDGSLIACDIWMAGTGQSIGGYNTQPKATALFDRMTDFLKKALADSAFPALDKYYLLDLNNDGLILVLNFDKYLWGMLISKSKVQLGLLLNVIIPDVTEELNAAIKG